jgi:hypothetical protein
MIGSLFVIALGLMISGASLWELADRIRLHRRMRRARGVVVARHEVGHMAGPGVRSRAAHFRFTTETGRVVERTSGLSSFPGPKPGRILTVVYDPARPESTAERAGVHLAFILLAPLVAAVGVVIMIWGLVRL